MSGSFSLAFMLASPTWIAKAMTAHFAYIVLTGNQGIRESVRCEDTTRAANAEQGRPSTTNWLQLQRLGGARVIEDEDSLAVIRRTIYDHLSGTVTAVKAAMDD